MRSEVDSEVQAAVRSWYVTAATLIATAVLLVATGWHTSYLRLAAAPATAAAVLTWSEGRRRRTIREPASGMAVTWLAVLVIMTGVVALFGIVTS